MTNALTFVGSGARSCGSSMSDDANQHSIPAIECRCLAAAVFFATIVPRVAQRGMFLDGMTYAVIARNMASGIGTFWRPSFSSTTYSTFHEQPPLGIGLEALAFAALGDHLLVERLFSIAVFCGTALIVVATWRQLLPSRYDWLPLFFWVLPSVVTWAVINNMLENTQALFTTLSIFCLLRASRTASAATCVWTCGAAAAVCAACLTKGPVGFFPLAVAPLLLLLPSDKRPSVKCVLRIWAGMLILTGALFGALLVSQAARHSIAEFTTGHLVPVLEGKRGLPRKSAAIAKHLTLGIWARMSALLLVLWSVRRKRRGARRFEPASLFFFVSGLVASLPILVSPVIAGHYFVPAVPLFALAAGAACLPTMQAGAGTRSSRVGRFAPMALALSLTVLSVAILVLHGPMERRDTELISRLDAVESVIPVGRTIGACPSTATEWGLQAYLQRFFRVSLQPDGQPSAGWFVVASHSCEIPFGCTPVAGDSGLRLFECRDRRRL